VSPRLRAGVIAGATLALFALAIGLFVLPFAYPTPPPIVTRFQATRVFSPNARPDGTRDVARVSVRLRQRSRVTLEIKDSKGHVVLRLLDDTHPRGWIRPIWTGRDQAGARVPDGTYSLALRARSGRKRWNSSRRIVVDTTPPSLRSLEVTSAALSEEAGAECRLTVTSRGDGGLTLEAVRAGRVLRRLGPRPVSDDETVHWSWDGVRDDGRPARVGLVLLRARLADASGNPIVREHSCWLGRIVGRAVPSDPAAGARVRVHLRTAAGAALDPGTPTALALYRRVGTPGRDLGSPLGRRVARAARGPAGRVTLRLPARVRPSALWLVATTRRGVALIPLPSP
jgi:FlgD Ig-like domain